MGAISVIIILSLTILPQLTFGQIPTLDKLNIENSLAPQCLDFNQDKICEYMLLANGTMVRNPDISSGSGSSTGSPNLNSFVAGIPQQSGQIEGKCMGLGYNYYKNLLMPDGKVVSNPNIVEPTYEELGIGSSTTQAQTVDDEEVLTYCDVPNPSNPCHDRKDFDEETGLYTCIDMSHVVDWRQCTGGGVEENDDDNDSNEIDNDNDGLDVRERNDEIGEDLPQEGGCQGDDDFCDADEECQSESVDCIDDREFDEDDYDG